MRFLALSVGVGSLVTVPWRPMWAQNPPESSAAASPASAAAAAPASSGPSVRFTGYVQARETYREGVGLGGSINRARLTAFGNAAKDVTWRVQGEFRTGSVGTGKASVSLQDAHIRYKTGPFGIQAGQFKTPFTREFITSLVDVETADRATVVDSIAPKRDIGVRPTTRSARPPRSCWAYSMARGRTSRPTRTRLSCGWTARPPVPWLT